MIHASSLLKAAKKLTCSSESLLNMTHHSGWYIRYLWSLLGWLLFASIAVWWDCSFWRHLFYIWYSTFLYWVDMFYPSYPIYLYTCSPCQTSQTGHSNKQPFLLHFHALLNSFFTSTSFRFWQKNACLFFCPFFLLN